MTGNTGKFSLDCPVKEQERKMIRVLSIVRSFLGLLIKGRQAVKEEIGEWSCFIALLL